jgi:phasin family protein
MVRAAGNNLRGTPVSKTKSTTEKAPFAFETTIPFGPDTLKAGFEKTAKLCGSANEFGKDTAKAYMESAAITGKAVQTMNSEVYAFTKQSAADAMAAGKAIMASKSIHEAFEVQADFAKSSFEAYMSQLTKFGELFTVTAKDSCAPLKGRVEALTALVQSAHV